MRVYRESLTSVILGLLTADKLSAGKGLEFQAWNASSNKTVNICISWLGSSGKKWDNTKIDILWLTDDLGWEGQHLWSPAAGCGFVHHGGTCRDGNTLKVCLTTGNVSFLQPYLANWGFWHLEAYFCRLASVLTRSGVAAFSITFSSEMLSRVSSPILVAEIFKFFYTWVNTFFFFIFFLDSVTEIMNPVYSPGSSGVPYANAKGIGYPGE